MSKYLDDLAFKSSLMQALLLVKFLKRTIKHPVLPSDQ
jgi:hypothetical protein